MQNFYWGKPQFKKASRASLGSSHRSLGVPNKKGVIATWLPGIHYKNSNTVLVFTWHGGLIFGFQSEHGISHKL